MAWNEFEYMTPDPRVYGSIGQSTPSGYRVWTPSGSVAGTSSNRSGSSSSSSSSGGSNDNDNDGDEVKIEKPDEPKGPSFEDLLREIQSAYGPVISGIDEQIAELPQRQEKFMGNLLSNVEAQQGRVGLAQEQGEAQLAENRERARSEEKTTLRTLAEDIRNLFQAGNIKLGGMGASDSSAAEMLKYAIAKQGNRRTADVVNKTRQIYSDINNLGAELVRKTKDQLLAIDQWKAGEEQKILSYIDSLKTQLQNQKTQIGSATAARQIEAVAEAYQYARNLLDQIEINATEYKNQLAVDYEMRQRDLNDYAEKMAMAAQYGGTYPGSVPIGIQGLQQETNSTQVNPGYIPTYSEDEEEEGGLFNNLKDTVSGWLG